MHTIIWHSNTLMQTGVQDWSPSKSRMHSAAHPCTHAHTHTFEVGGVCVISCPEGTLLPFTSASSSYPTPQQNAHSPLHQNMNGEQRTQREAINTGTVTLQRATGSEQQAGHTGEHKTWTVICTRPVAIIRPHAQPGLTPPYEDLL